MEQDMINRNSAPLKTISRSFVKVTVLIILLSVLTAKLSFSENTPLEWTVVSPNGELEITIEQKETLPGCSQSTQLADTRIFMTGQLVGRSPMCKPIFEVGVGFGTDVQGIVSLPFADDGFEIEYPFTSYDGTVTFNQPVIGNREIDFNTEGIVHYGLYAEWMENFRQLSEERNDDSLELFLNSAETYLQMWARAELAAIE